MNMRWQDLRRHLSSVHGDSNSRTEDNYRVSYGDSYRVNYATEDNHIT